MFDLSSLLVWLPVILISITIHEFSHGLVADYLGDPTARYAGRLSLNPIAHLDPIGMLMLIVVHFGWAKPVPVNANNFKDPQKGMALVGLAGPFSNLLLAWGLAMFSRYLLPVLPEAPLWVYQMIGHAIWLNIALAVFNFIPIPPLDGSRILSGVLSPMASARLAQLEQYGFLFIIMLLFLPGTSDLIFGTVNFLFRLFLA